MFTLAAATTVSGIAGVAVAEAFGKPGVVVGAANDVVTVNTKVAIVVTPLFRRSTRAESVVRSSEGPGTGVDIVINGYDTVARGETAPRALLLRRRRPELTPSIMWSVFIRRDILKSSMSEYDFLAMTVLIPFRAVVFPETGDDQALADSWPAAAYRG